MLLIVGANGHVGRAVVSNLVQSRRVRALVRNPSAFDIRHPNVDVAAGDLGDPSALERALEGVDTAFLASRLGASMAEQQIRFIELAKAAGVRRIVQLSGMGADMERSCVRALSWYGQVEQALLASGLEHVRLRPTIWMQVLLKAAPEIAAQGVIHGPYRNVPWVWVDARDVAAVATAVLTQERHNGKCYTLTSSEALTFVELAGRMSSVLNRPVRYLDVTANEMRGRLQATGASPLIIAATLELCDAYVSGFLRVEVSSAVQDITGRAPRTMEQFLVDYRDAFVCAA